MRKRILFLSIIIMIVGFVVFLVGIFSGIGILGVIGFISLLIALVASLISRAIDTDTGARDTTSWDYRPEEGLQHPTQDKSQLPGGEYGMGHK